MMKKLIASILCIAIMLTSAIAFAETGDIKRFAPYTNVDLNVFIDKGYSCYYDDFEFMAEISPANSTITYGSGGSYGDTYTINMDIKIIYSAGSCTLVPRLIFTRKGFNTYCDTSMKDVYIKNGENRYIIDVSGCSRSSSSKNYTATDTSVEPMYVGGWIMLQDIAEYPQTISVKMGSYADTHTLTTAQQQQLKEFYEDCKAAGIFDQDFLLRTDDYTIKTLFNENDLDAKEDVTDEQPTPEGEA